MTAEANSYIIFVDYPEIDPCQEDNSICEKCFPRSRYRDDGHCFLTAYPSLHEAIQYGWAKQNETIYPPEWLDKRVGICKKGYVYLSTGQL